MTHTFTHTQTGSWVTTPDGIPAWRQPDGSLWRQAADGSWIPVPSPAAQTVGLQLPRLRASTWTVLIGLGTGLIGVMLPWATALLVVHVSGIDLVTGKTYAVCGIAALAFLYLRYRTGRVAFRFLLPVCCLIMALIGGLSVAGAVDVSTDVGGFVKAGAGLYLSAIGGAVAAVASFVEVGPRRGSPNARGYWISLAVVVAMLVSLGVVGRMTRSDHASDPASVVEGYLTALANGDADEALSYGPNPGSTTFLTDDVLAQQQAIAKISDITMGDVERSATVAKVPVTYTFGSKTVDTQFYVRKRSGEWQLEDTTVTVSVYRLSDDPALTLFGQPVSGLTTIRVFPGPLRFGSSDANFTITDANAGAFNTVPGPFGNYLPDFTTELTAAGRQKLVDAVTTKLTACAKATSLRPTGCPQYVYSYGEVLAGSVVWTMTKDVERLRYNVAVIDPQTVSVLCEAEWAVTYRTRDFASAVDRVRATVRTFVHGTVDLREATPTLTLS